MRSFYLMNSHRWLYSQLMTGLPYASDYACAPTPSEGDLIIYPVPPAVDPQAPDRLRRLTLRDLSRVYLYSQDDEPLIWAPGMYASLPLQRNHPSAFCGGFYVQPGSQDGPIGDALKTVEQRDPDLLWSFIGSARTSPALRSQILSIEDGRSIRQDSGRWRDVVRWKWWTPAYADEARAIGRKYAETLVRSKFVLCPRGYGRGSYRVFEAMRLGRCPVIVSDGWVPPPFIDWSKCALFVPESEVDDIPRRLRQFEPRAAELGANAYLGWSRFFSPERQLVTLLRAIEDIHSRFGRSRPARLRIALRSVPTREFARRRVNGMKRVVKMTTASGRSWRDPLTAGEWRRQ